jgi:RHS repeat-associated protein
LRRAERWVARQGERRTLLGDAWLEGVEEHGGGRFRYTYNQAGDLTRIVEADGSTRSYAYDDRRRLLQVEHPDGSRSRYRYDAYDRLLEIDGPFDGRRFEYDDHGRVICTHRGAAGAAAYRYDGQGRVIEYRTACVSTRQTFDAMGRVAAIQQTLNGVPLELQLAYDDAGRLSQVRLPGSTAMLQYTWDARGRPASIEIGHRTLARFQYFDPDKVCLLHLGNGVIERSQADAVDARPLSRRWSRDGEVLGQRSYEYDADGQCLEDGSRAYGYDALGRLVSARCQEMQQAWTYQYDAMDHRTPPADLSLTYDRAGRLIGKRGRGHEWVYRYDDAGQLIEALDHGNSMACFTYDAKGRLAAMHAAGRSERYLYGPADELFAVADEQGRPLRLSIRTPFGCLAEVRGPLESGDLHFLHQDERGTCRLVTDQRGSVIARLAYDPYGMPLPAAPPSEVPLSEELLSEASVLPCFHGRCWNPAVRMYHFGARWYDPELGRFLTPDSYTAAPDDARLVHPLGAGAAQAVRRDYLLSDWLKRPRTRNGYTFCGNDPVGNLDPDGHWAVGYVILSVLGAIWTLPNTIFGLLVEITCLLGELIRLIVSAISPAHAWEAVGFDAAASGRLNAFALVFEGGWLGSFPSLLGITFGNVFFVYKRWQNTPQIAAGGMASPPAYGGAVSFPIIEALYEHELRHTNQYGWFGPFFHLGLPVFGVYEWDVIVHGYQNAWLERDARDYGGF